MEEEKTKVTQRSGQKVLAGPMSQRELQQLGDGFVAYIKTLTADEAERMFPAIKGLPRGIPLYALHAADGTPLALTDTRQAAIGHAIGDELEIASVH